MSMHPPVANPHPPTKLKLPPGATDTHCHLFGPWDRFPLPPKDGRPYLPAEAHLQMYEHMQQRLGLSRAVFVQSVGYGRDHAALLDALKQGRGRYAGTAILDETAGDDEIARLHEAGVRGTRFHFMSHLGHDADTAQVLRVAERVAKHGWHLLLHVDGRSLLQYARFFETLPTPFIVDHMGRIDGAAGVQQPAFQALLDLLKLDRCWVKISGADRITKRTAPPYDDVTPFARALVAAAPDRVLWGTDWPHTNMDRVPDDGDLADLLAAFVPDEALRRRILVDNPQRLYDFA
jgi:2-pyrone-4,6-dicarboxylate lactonase